MGLKSRCHNGKCTAPVVWRWTMSLPALAAALMALWLMRIAAAQTLPAEAPKIRIVTLSQEGFPRVSTVSNKLSASGVATTGKDGRCEIASNDSQVWFAQSVTSGRCALFTVTPGTAKPVVVKLDSSVGTCYGRVTNGNGRGLKGVGVIARVSLPDGRSLESAPQMTDGAGYYQLGRVPMAEGLSVQVRPAAGGGAWSPAIKLSSHMRDVYLADLVEKEGGSPGEKSAWASFGGVVRGEDGAPVEGAEVEVMWKVPSELGSRSRTAMTDATGRWVALMPPEAGVTFLQVWQPKFVMESGGIGAWGPSPDQLRAGTAVTVLRRGLPLDGVVRDEKGSPVPDVLILTNHNRISTSRGGGVPRLIEDPSMVRTKSDGTFRVESLGPGARELSTYSEEYLTATKDITVRPGMKSVEITLSRGGSVTGVVLDQKGNPVAGITVSASIPASSGLVPEPLRIALTDTNGHFQLDVLPKEKPFTLVARGAFGMSGEYRGATVKDVPYLITVAPSGRGGGGNLITILDDSTGAPVSRYRLFDGPQFVDGGPAEFSKGLRFTVDSKDGTYIRRAVYRQPPIGLAIRVIADGYFPAESPIVRGGESKPFVLRLKAGKPVAGTLVDVEGNAVGGAQVAWVSPERQAFIDANGKISDFYVASPEVVVMTESDGRFRFPPGLPAGAIVGASEKGYGQIPSNAFHDGVAIKLSPWGRVEGRLMRGSRPPANVRMEAFPTEDQARAKSSPVRWMLWTTTRPDGSFVFEHLPAAPMAVGISEVRGASSRVVVDPKAGQTVRVQIGGAGGEVSGELQFPADLGITRAPAEIRAGQPRVSIVLRPASDSADDPTQTPDEVDPRRLFYSGLVSDGRHFTFYDVPAGEYVLHVKVLAPPAINPRGGYVVIGRASMPVGVAEGKGTIDVGEVRIMAVPKEPLK